MQLFICKKATEDQRKAIANIFMGKAKGFIWKVADAAEQGDAHPDAELQL